MPDEQQLPGVDGAAAALIDLYQRAHDRVQVMLQVALESGAIGTAAYRQQTLHGIDAIMAALASGTRGAPSVVVDTAYRAGAHAVDATTPAGQLLGGFSWGGVHTTAVEVLAKALTDSLDESRSTVGREARDLFRRVVVEQNALAVAAGGDRDAPTKHAIADLQAHGVTCFRDKAGRRWSLQNYCEMATRTTAREACSWATENRMVQAGQDLVTISKHRSETDICTPYEGNTYSLTGKTKGHPVLDKRPPFHPRCWHVMFPAAANLDAFEAALAEPPPPAVAPGQEGGQAAVAKTGDPLVDLVAQVRAEHDAMRNLRGGVSGQDARVIEVGTAITDHVQELADVRLGQLEEQQRVASDQVVAAFKEIDALTDAMLAATKKHGPNSPEYNALRDKRAPLEQQEAERRRRVYQLGNQIRNVFADTLLQEMGRLRPGYGQGMLDVPKRGAAGHLSHEAATRFPREWVEASNASPTKVRIATGGPRSRGYYQHVDVDTKTGATVGRVQARNASVMTHEWAHRFQWTLDAPAAGNLYPPPSLLNKLCTVFHLGRVKGTTRKRLSDLRPASNYDDAEVTREDKYEDPYMGKEYDMPGGAVEPLEILTMGVQGVWHGAYNLHNNDPDYFDFIVGLLATV